MKRITSTIAALLMAALSAGPSFGQAASELFGASAPAASPAQLTAPTVGPITVDFLNNAANPTANTAATAIGAPTPQITITAVNQAFATTPDGLIIGDAQNTVRRFAASNVLGSGVANQFTSLPVHGAGQGITIGANATSNYAFAFETSSTGLQVSGTAGAGRFRIADLVIDFNHPVENPVLHFIGMGGSSGGKNFTSEFTFVPGQSVGATGIARLSGTANFAVAGNNINHSGAGANIGAACNAANSGACGSVHFTGQSVTRIYLQVFLKSTQATAWPAAGVDAFLMGASAEFANMTANAPTAVPAAPVAGTTYTGLQSVCRNNGPNTARGSQCAPTVSAGTISALNCAPVAAFTALAVNGTITCTYSYTLTGANPLPSTITFNTTTTTRNDRFGGANLTATDNIASVSRTSVTPAFIQATKNLSVYSQDGSGCEIIPGTPGPITAASIPGSCLEYVITLTNRGTTDATNVNMEDIVGPDFTFISAQRSGFNETTAGFQFIAPPANANCGVSTCSVRIENGRLALDQVGTIRIRVLLN